MFLELERQTLGRKLADLHVEMDGCMCKRGTVERVSRIPREHTGHRNVRKRDQQPSLVGRMCPEAITRMFTHEMELGSDVEPLAVVRTSVTTFVPRATRD